MRLRPVSQPAGGGSARIAVAQVGSVEPRCARAANKPGKQDRPGGAPRRFSASPPAARRAREAQCLSAWPGRPGRGAVACSRPRCQQVRPVPGGRLLSVERLSEPQQRPSAGRAARPLPQDDLAAQEQLAAPDSPMAALRSIAPAGQTSRAAHPPHSNLAFSTSSGDSAKTAPGCNCAAARYRQVLPRDLPARPLPPGHLHRCHPLSTTCPASLLPLTKPGPGQTRKARGPCQVRGLWEGSGRSFSEPVPVPSPDADPTPPALSRSRCMVICSNWVRLIGW